MLQFTWNEFDFTLLQYGKGVFTKDMVGHSHAKNSYELHYILDGEGLLTTEYKKYPLRKGMFFVTGPHVYHQQSTNPQNPLTEVYIYLQASEKKTNHALAYTFLETHFFFQEICPFAEIFCRLLKEEEEKRLSSKLPVFSSIALCSGQYTLTISVNNNCIKAKILL